MSRPCIVCLEHVNDANTLPILSAIYNNCRMHWQTCGCKINAHVYCIQEWYLLNPKCPYCKENVYRITFYPITISSLSYSAMERTLLDTMVATAQMIINSITIYICIDIFLNTIHYCE